MDAFAPDGYVLLPQAAPSDALAAYPDALDAARDGLLVRRPDAPQVELAGNAPDAPPVDPYAIVEPARTLLLAPALVELLTAAYGDKPLLFDTSGGGAPEAGPYRDATYTALATEPDTLVTIAVALAETTIDVFPGSQDIATTPFSGRYAAFNPERDGDDALDRHRAELNARLIGDPDTITLNPGDILAWTAGLVHTPPRGDALIAHLCPDRVQPAWFTYRPERARHAAAADGGACLTTQHYDLVDAYDPEPPDDDDPTPAEDERELERVEAALREHDAEDAPPPEAPHAVRRHGGLVDSVRGLLGRRGKS
jgi:hypothetical protein